MSLPPSLPPQPSVEQLSGAQGRRKERRRKGGMNGRNLYPCCRVWRSDQGYSGQLGKGQELSPAHLSSSILAVTLRCPFTCHSWTDSTTPSSTHFFPPSGVQCSYPGAGSAAKCQMETQPQPTGKCLQGCNPHSLPHLLAGLLFLLCSALHLLCPPSASYLGILSPGRPGSPLKVGITHSRCPINVDDFDMEN